MRVAIFCAFLSAAMAPPAQSAQVSWQPLRTAERVATQASPQAASQPSRANNDSPVTQRLAAAHGAYDQCVQAQTLALGDSNQETADTILTAVRARCNPQWMSLVNAWPIPDWQALSGWRQDSEGRAIGALLDARAKGSATQPASAAQRGRIIMYRGSSIVGSALACPIRYQGQEIVELARGKYAQWSVPPGRYILTNHTSSVEVAVDSGETRYVRCMIKMGMLVGRADLQIADEESFNEHRNEYSQKRIENVSVPVR
jgi:hypothetical protein